MTFALPKKTYLLWQIRALVVLAALYAAIVSFCRNYPNVLLPTTIATAIWSVFLLVYISLYLSKYKISIEKSGLYIMKGIVFKTTIIIPHPHLALIKAFTTPVTYRLNLCGITIKIFRSLIFIPELDEIDAKTLLDLIHYD